MRSWLFAITIIGLLFTGAPIRSQQMVPPEVRAIAYSIESGDTGSFEELIVSEGYLNKLLDPDRLTTNELKPYLGTALTYAISYGSVESAKWLLRRGAKVNEENELNALIENPHPSQKLLDLIISSGCNPCKDRMFISKAFSASYGSWHEPDGSQPEFSWGEPTLAYLIVKKCTPISVGVKELVLAHSYRPHLIKYVCGREIFRLANSGLFEMWRTDALHAILGGKTIGYVSSQRLEDSVRSIARILIDAGVDPYIKRSYAEQGWGELDAFELSEKLGLTDVLTELKKTSARKPNTLANKRKETSKPNFDPGDFETTLMLNGSSKYKLRYTYSDAFLSCEGQLLEVLDSKGRALIRVLEPRSISCAIDQLAARYTKEYSNDYEATYNRGVERLWHFVTTVGNRNSSIVKYSNLQVCSDLNVTPQEVLEKAQLRVEVVQRTRKID